MRERGGVGFPGPRDRVRKWWVARDAVGWCGGFAWEHHDGKV